MKFNLFKTGVVGGAVGVLLATSAYITTASAGTNGYASIRTTADYVSTKANSDADSVSDLIGQHDARLGFTSSVGNHSAKAEFRLQGEGFHSVRDVWIGTKVGNGTLKIGRAYTVVDTGAWPAVGKGTDAAFVTGNLLASYRSDGIHYSADLGGASLGLNLGTADDRAAEDQPVANVIGLNVGINSVPNLTLNLGYQSVANNDSDNDGRDDETAIALVAGYKMNEIYAELTYLAQEGVGNIADVSRNTIGLVATFGSYYAAFSMPKSVDERGTEDLEIDTTVITLGGSTDMGDGLSLTYGLDNVSMTSDDVESVDGAESTRVHVGFALNI